MTDWDRPWPELEGLSELERYHLMRAAKKRMYLDLNGYVIVLAYGIAAVGLALAIQLVPRLFSPSMWVDVLFWTIGLFVAIYVFDRLYYHRLRRMLRVVVDERKHQASEQA